MTAAWKKCWYAVPARTIRKKHEPYDY